jgi:hypothetical protein
MMMFGLLGVGSFLASRGQPPPRTRAGVNWGKYWGWKLTALPSIAIGVIGLILWATGH